ncbi:MAG: hypothetical protein HS116_19285 [Planctomycetes bacterium]|nr:hypothetical protein [Planctomycetota bacterium]
MSFEDDFIQDLAGHGVSGDKRDHVIQVAQTIKDGQVVARVFVPPFARIGAVASTEGLFLKRQYGQTSPGLSIPWSVYPAVMTVLRHWEKHRDEWWAFYYSNSGFPGGMGGAAYVVRPGKESLHEQVYRSVLGHKTGEPPQGTDRSFGLDEPEAIGEGVIITQHIRRVGLPDSQGPIPEVGLVYQLPDGMECKAWRMEARIARGGAHVFIEPDELMFLNELQRLRESGLT